MLLLIGSFCYGQGSLQFNQVQVFSNTESILTVPANKVWKITNVNGGDGQITVTGASSRHCGTTCGGGSCSSSSCRYRGFVWELNGVPLDPVDGCFICAGSTCSNISNCPPTHTFNASQLPTINTPFWLETGNTLEINASNVFFSVIEFNIIP
jgi:hypothetical protein